MGHSCWLQMTSLACLIIMFDLGDTTSIKFGAPISNDEDESCTNSGVSMESMLDEHNQVEQHNDKHTIDGMIFKFMADNDNHHNDFGQYDFDDHSQDDCNKRNMAYEMIDHGIKFEAPHSMEIYEVPEKEQIRHKIPAPVKIITAKPVLLNQAHLLEEKKLHLEKKFHLKSPKTIMGGTLNQPVREEIITVDKIKLEEPKSWQNHKELNQIPAIHNRVSNDFSEMDQQQKRIDDAEINTIEPVEEGHKTGKHQPISISDIERPKDDLSGFDDNSDQQITSRPIFGNVPRFKNSLIVAATYAKNLTSVRSKPNSSN